MSASIDPPTLVVPASDEALLRQCRVETMRGGGSGGQHRNVTDSAVRITHLPTGISAIAGERRSQHRNRQAALKRLRQRLAERLAKKPRRIPTAVPEGERRRRLEAKRRRAQAKALRRRPEEDG